MPDGTRQLVRASLAALAVSGCAVMAAVCLATAAASAPAPAPSASTPTAAPGSPARSVPIQVIVPTPAARTTSSGVKDFLVPLATLLGAALAFGGAVMGARLAANAQDRRSRQEAETKRQEEDRNRGIKRLEAFSDQANSLMGTAATLANSGEDSWSLGEKAISRGQLRLQAAQMLGVSRLLDASLQEEVDRFVGSVVNISNAPTAAQARQSAQGCGAAFESLMFAIGTELQRI